MAQHLYVRHLGDWNDFFKPVTDVFQTRWYVLVEQDHQVALFHGVIPRFDPTRNVSFATKKKEKK